MKESAYRENILPDFVIIGAQKSGTTSLHYYLNCHPEISMSQEKELDFFIEQENWHKGIDWYKSQFKGEAKIYGESSPNYTNFPRWQGVPQRIHSIIPQAKLIYLLRDPIQRIISGYIHLYSSGYENRDFLAAIEENKNYVYRSRYYLQIEQFLDFFSQDNIFICSMEELSNSPQETLKSICQFLGVSEDISMIQHQKVLHKSTYKRRRNKIGNAIAKSKMMRNLDLLPLSYRSALKKIIYFPFSSAVKKPAISQEVQDRLVHLLQDDVNNLRKFTGKKFEQWCL